jgi:hypothetical protein
VQALTTSNWIEALPPPPPPSRWINSMIDSTSPRSENETSLR